MSDYKAPETIQAMITEDGNLHSASVERSMSDAAAMEYHGCKVVTYFLNASPVSNGKVSISRECADRSLSRAIEVNSFAGRHNLNVYEDVKEFEQALSTKRANEESES